MAVTNNPKGQGILENPEAVIDDSIVKSEEFVRKNKNIIGGVFIALLLAAAGIFFYKYQKDEKNTEAQAEMFGAVYYFENDSLNLALKGNGKDIGFLDIIEDYSGTKAAKLANFYTGVIYLRQGKFDDAVSSLNDFESDDLLLQARAYSLIGDANLELNNIDDAIKFYEKAASFHPNEFFTPRYLLKLAMGHELNKDFTAAIADYDKIIKDFYKSNDVNEAKKLKALAEAKAEQ